MVTRHGDALVDGTLFEVGDEARGHAELGERVRFDQSTVACREDRDAAERRLERNETKRLAPERRALRP